MGEDEEKSNKAKEEQFDQMRILMEAVKRRYQFPTYPVGEVTGYFRVKIN